MSTFDQVVTRLGTNSEKWDGAEKLFGRKDLIPMWVADMDFKAPDVVIEALHKRAESGVFGYELIPDSLPKAIIEWNKNRHNYVIKKESLFYNVAVVPSISLLIRALTKEGDGVLMHSPIYHPFFKVTKATRRQVVMSPLRYEDGQYQIDLEDMEKRIREENIKLFLLCNPQNPGGRCYSKEELQAIASLCATYNIPIVSDEIHSDLVMKQYKHIPLAVAAPDYEDEIITLMAPTKTFNLAAIKASYFIITNPDYQEKVRAEQAYMSQPDLNAFAIAGMEAAYTGGAEWLDELRDYIYDNYLYVKKALNEALPEITVTELQATYLMWLDCRSFESDEKTIYQNLIDEGVGVQMGSTFGLSGKKFVRLNIACPRETLEKGTAALIAGLKKNK